MGPQLPTHFLVENWNYLELSANCTHWDSPTECFSLGLFSPSGGRREQFVRDGLRGASLPGGGGWTLPLLPALVHPHHGGGPLRACDLGNGARPLEHQPGGQEAAHRF